MSPDFGHFDHLQQPNIESITIETIDDLRDVLHQNNIDYSNWGNDPENKTKSIDKLFLEIRKEESELFYINGELIRRVSVANIDVTTTNPKTRETFILYEAERYDVNNQLKPRKTPLPSSIAGKLKPNETPEDAAIRELLEETGLTPKTIKKSGEPETETEDSKSYPGLKALYIAHNFDAEIDFNQYKEEGYEVYEDEHDSDGNYLGQKRTVTKWKKQ